MVPPRGHPPCAHRCRSFWHNPCSLQTVHSRQTAAASSGLGPFHPPRVRDTGAAALPPLQRIRRNSSTIGSGNRIIRAPAFGYLRAARPENKSRNPASVRR